MEQRKKEVLVDLLTYLRKNNSFYSNCLHREKRNEELSVKEILREIPIISRIDILENMDKYISNKDEDDNILWELTSGTTGTPFICYKTKKERMLLALAEWKCRKERDPKVTSSNFFQLMGVNDKYHIDFANYSDGNVKKIFELMAKENTRWICGSPTTIYNYAKKIEAKVVSHIHTVKFIELQGEYADVNVRRYIEKQFKCKTVIHYGNRECWAMAYECSHGLMHVMDNIILENIIDEQGNPIIVATNLIAKKMPFLRYNTGDLGIISRCKCDCGKEGDVIEILGGRMANIIPGYDVVGDILFKKIIHNIINKKRLHRDIIRNFRVEQRAKDLFVYYLDKGPDFVDDYYQEIIEKTKAALGEKVNVEFEEFLRTNGKYKIFQPMANGT